jgi:two-component system sensor histidine kinase HydH
LELEPVQIAKVCEHVCRLVAPELNARDIKLEVHLSSPLPALVADPGQLTQALLNLVINAIQAVERQGRIDIYARQDSEALLVVEVRDSGPGVQVENRAAIFDPYFTTKPNGSGLGLWIAQQIIVAHGGEIQVANMPARGAMFTIALPLQPTRPLHEQIKD